MTPITLSLSLVPNQIAVNVTNGLIDWTTLSVTVDLYGCTLDITDKIHMNQDLMDTIEQAVNFKIMRDKVNEPPV